MQVRERAFRSIKVPGNRKGSKHRLVEPSLENVIDFDVPDLDPRVRKLDGLNLDRLKELRAREGGALTEEEEDDGNKPVYYEIEGRPGFYFVKNALNPAQQVCWARECLASYST